MNDLNKYNRLWLEANNLDENWHNEQSKVLEDAIRDCRSTTLLIVVTDIFVMEAMLSILYKYDFRVSNLGNIGKEISIYIK